MQSNNQEKPIYISVVDFYGFFRIIVRPRMTLNQVLGELMKSVEVGFQPGDFIIGKDEDIYEVVSEDEILFLTKIREAKDERND